MRYFRITALLVIALAFLAGIACAQSPEGEKGSSMPEKMNDMPMDKEGMGGMMKMMMQKEMIASGDGGVIILVGNKLLKYDKNLNLVKEVELKTDMARMHKRKEKMQEKCRRREEMMESQDKEKEGKQ